MNRLLTVSLVAIIGAAAPSGAFPTQETSTAKPTSGCDVALEPSVRRALAWSDYEFGQTAGLPMTLQSQGCFSEAAAASRDYLAFGPPLSTREQAITTFHMGRNLAFAGREAEAAIAVAASRRSDQAAGGLDWNRYVQGVYAFLVKDVSTLEKAVVTLGASQSEGDQKNAANLRQLKACFTRSYLSAMNDPACVAAANVPAQK